MSDDLADMFGVEAYVPPPEEEEVKEKKLSPFDFINALSYTKEDLLADEANEKQYNAFIINRGFSYGSDTVMYANEMNLKHHLPKDMQFDFYLHALRKMKRYNKWQKAEPQSDDLKAIIVYYGYSAEKAKKALEILTPDQIATIKLRLNKGGIAANTKPKKTRKK